jgi:hypothetical protein
MHSVTFVSTHQRRTDFGCTITLPAQKLKQPPPAPTVSEPPFVARQVHSRGFDLCHILKSFAWSFVMYPSCSVCRVCSCVCAVCLAHLECTFYDSLTSRLNYPPPAAARPPCRLAPHSLPTGRHSFAESHTAQRARSRTGHRGRRRHRGRGRVAQPGTSGTHSHASALSDSVRIRMYTLPTVTQ